jgi:hypothetical protein
MTGQLVDPQPSTDNPPNPFIVPQPCELQDPEVAADTSGYDSSEGLYCLIQTSAAYVVLLLLLYSSWPASST